MCSSDLNDMLILGTAAGGSERRIALAHASRILVVITCVGLFNGFVLGVRPEGSGGRPWIAIDVLTLEDWLWLGGCALVGVPFGKLLRAPAPNMLGPMLLSAALHLGEVVETAPPTLVIVMSQIVLGTVIGCRFLGATFREVGRDLGLGALSSFAMLLVAVAFAFVAAELTGAHPSQIFLAYSPGGTDRDVASCAGDGAGCGLCIGHAPLANSSGDPRCPDGFRADQPLD